MAALQTSFFLLLGLLRGSPAAVLGRGRRGGLCSLPAWRLASFATK